jgi:hypothetical protein
MSESFELEITLRGPEESYESQYGPRTQRATLARLEVPISGPRGWAIYQEAMRSSLQPDYIITLPDGLTEEEAQKIRDEFKARRA